MSERNKNTPKKQRKESATPVTVVVRVITSFVGRIERPRDEGVDDGHQVFVGVHEQPGHGVPAKAAGPPRTKHTNKTRGKKERGKKHATTNG